MKRESLAIPPLLSVSAHEGIDIDFNCHYNQVGYCILRTMSCIPSIPFRNVFVRQVLPNTNSKVLCSGSQLDDIRPPSFSSLLKPPSLGRIPLETGRMLPSIVGMIVRPR